MTFFFCVFAEFWSSALNNPAPPPSPSPPLSTPLLFVYLCCSTAVSWWKFDMFLIWSTCCPVLPDSMRKRKKALWPFIFWFILYSFCHDSYFTFFISVSSYSVFFLCICLWIFFSHLSRLIRSSYILFMKKQAFGKKVKKNKIKFVLFYDTPFSMLCVCLFGHWVVWLSNTKEEASCTCSYYSYSHDQTLQTLI